MTVYGWDLSNHDWDRHPVDLADARRSGISFATHKATEGCPAAGEYADPYFAAFAQQLAHVDLPVAGSYHATHKGNAVAQADFWFDTVNAKFPGWRQHPCWIWQIDAEPLDGYAAPSKADIVAIGQRIQQRAGVPASMIVAYAPHWVYGDSLKGLPYRLWASNYVDRGRVFKALYPGDQADHWAAYSGQTPLILQFTSGATIGAQHTCDANAVRVPDEAALVALFKPQGGSPLSGLTKDELAQVAQAVRAEVLNYPITSPSNGVKYPLLSYLVNADVNASQALAKISSVATVVNAVAPRVAALQAAVDKLGTAVGALQPAAQVAIDVAAIAAATADAVMAKVKDLVWKVGA